LQRHNYAVATSRGHLQSSVVNYPHKHIISVLCFCYL